MIWVLVLHVYFYPLKGSYPEYAADISIPGFPSYSECEKYGKSTVGDFREIRFDCFNSK